MTIQECLDKKEWLKNEGNEFLQSWDWGEFQQSVGHQVLRLKGEDWQMQGFEQQLGLGFKYIYFPRVNLGNIMINDQLSVISDKIIQFLQDKKFVFIRIETINNQSLITNHQSFTRNRQPKQTLVLNLIKTEDELLSNMHAKTRYNIHLAKKKGIEIRQEKNIEVFWQLIQETSLRDEIRSHKKKYYAEMLKNDFCYQLTAYLADQPIASNILIIYKDACTYLHGASASQQRNLMAPYLLQWEGIKLAKKLGCQSYDFWGVAPLVDVGKDSDFSVAELAPQMRGSNSLRCQDHYPYQHTCFHNFCWEVNHKWTGITRFKVGFGGEYREYPRAVDVILKSFYYKLYKLAKKVL